MGECWPDMGFWPHAAAHNSSGSSSTAAQQRRLRTPVVLVDCRRGCCYSAPAWSPARSVRSACTLPSPSTPTPALPRCNLKPTHTSTREDGIDGRDRPPATERRAWEGGPLGGGQGGPVSSRNASRVFSDCSPGFPSSQGCMADREGHAKSANVHGSLDTGVIATRPTGNGPGCEIWSAAFWGMPVRSETHPGRQPCL